MSALLAASRPTRRDMARHPLRILAAVLLIALPTFAGAWMLTYAHSEAENSHLTLPRTQAHWSGGSCEQGVTGNAHCTPADTPTDEPVLPLLQDALPDGFTASLHHDAWGTATLDGAITQMLVVQEPAGRTPPPGTVWLSTTTARALGADVGDTITFRPDDVGGTADPVELLVDGTMPGFQALVAEPTLVDPADIRTTVESTAPASWSITGPRAFTWDDVLALNAAGFVVYSQDVIDNPPPPEEVPEQFRSPDPGARHVGTDWAGTLVFLVGYVVLGVLFLLIISPVFTIATSRMARNFALMSSQGATPWHIRVAVLTYGFAAGLVGGTVGIVLGVAAAAVTWFLRFPTWPFLVPWPGLLALWAVVVLGSTLAALLPAVVAARASISAGVQGAAPDRLLRWRPWMAVGPVGLVVLGAVTLVLRMALDRTALPFWSTLLALALVVLLAAGAPAIVWGLSRLGRGAPLPLRLALRDAGRQAMRSVPALAAIMTVLTVAVTVFVSMSAEEARSRALHDEVYVGQSLLIAPEMWPGSPPDARAVEDVVATVSDSLGDARRVDLRGVPHDLTSFPEIVPEEDCFTDDAAPECRFWARDVYSPGPLELSAAALLEATPEALSLLRLPADSPALAALGRPAALVSVDDPRAELTFRELEIDPVTGDTVTLAEVTVPTARVLPAFTQTVLLTPPALAELGVSTEYIGTVLLPEQPLTYAEQSELRNRVAADTTGVSLAISPGQWRAEWWPAAFAGVLGLGVLVVLTLVLALSGPESRRRFSLLDAIGAPPSLPARVSGAFAGVLALVGTVTGVVLGHLAAWLLSTRTEVDPSGLVLHVGTAGHMVPDWRVLLILLVLTPLAAWAVGSLFHRRPGVPEYRET